MRKHPNTINIIFVIRCSVSSLALVLWVPKHLRILSLLSLDPLDKSACLCTFYEKNTFFGKSMLVKCNIVIYIYNITWAKKIMEQLFPTLTLIKIAIFATINVMMGRMNPVRVKNL